jgi:triacylglycerol lipase
MHALRPIAALLLTLLVFPACGEAVGGVQEREAGADAADAGGGAGDADPGAGGDAQPDAGPPARDAALPPGDTPTEDDGAGPADGDGAQDAGPGDEDGEPGSGDDGGTPGRDAAADTAAGFDTGTAPDIATDDDGEPVKEACPERREAVEGDAFDRQRRRVDAPGRLCGLTLHALTVPAGARWEVEAEGLEEGTLMVAWTAHRFSGDLREAATSLGAAEVTGGRATVAFRALWSGEHAIAVETDATTAYRLQARCLEGCGLDSTRWPVALVHGYAGVDRYFGVLDYFFDVREPNRRRGFAVYTPRTDPIAFSTRRAEQLAGQLEAIRRETGARRFHLIAHSQGGLDGRVLISGMGWHDRIVSLTTIATPHRGIPLRLAEFLSVEDFTPEGAEMFNRMYPDHPDVRYWSWSARSCGVLEWGCIRRNNGEIVGVLLGPSYTLLLRFGPNDGIVPTASMPWGTLLGQLPADHFDQVGQIATPPLPGLPFDHRAFYRGELQRLADLGL